MFNAHYLRSSSVTNLDICSIVMVKCLEESVRDFMEIGPGNISGHTPINTCCYFLRLDALVVGPAVSAFPIVQPSFSRVLIVLVAIPVCLDHCANVLIIPLYSI